MTSHTGSPTTLVYEPLMAPHQKGSHALDGVGAGFIKGFTGLNIPVDFSIGKGFELNRGFNGLADTRWLIFADDGISGVYRVRLTAQFGQHGPGFRGTGGLSENRLADGDDRVGPDHPVIWVFSCNVHGFGVGQGFDIFSRRC